MTLVAPLNVNDVSSVTRINHERYFSWQAQYFVMLECHFSWKVQYLVLLQCHSSWHVQIFGDVAVSLFVAGAVFGEIWVDSRSANCCNLQCKMRLRSANSNLSDQAGVR